MSLPPGFPSALLEVALDLPIIRSVVQERRVGLLGRTFCTRSHNLRDAVHYSKCSFHVKSIYTVLTEDLADIPLTVSMSDDFLRVK